MSEARATNVLRALNGFFSGFLPAYAEGCAPDGAALPYITYQPVVPGPLQSASLTAKVWYRTRDYAGAAAALDAIGAAVGAGCCLPTGVGAVWLYGGERLMQLQRDGEDSAVKCAVLNMRVAANTE